MTNKYIINPKTKGSGIVCCIPQTGKCPMGCKDCFYNNRSYLEPLEDNLPNMPSLEQTKNKVVRVNDGNDSSNKRKYVIEQTKKYEMRFYNTSIHTNLEEFEEPVVLTINPGVMTDKSFYKLEKIPFNLMFVRIRTNTWNISMVRAAVKYYTEKKVPVVLTFMAYYSKDSIPDHSGYITDYVYRKRTLNSYFAITTKSWRSIMNEFKENILVHSCGKIEGEKGNTKCMYCGNCLREYFSCKAKMEVTK